MESGGGSELIDRQLEYAQLVEAIRFTAEWEREASLRLRTGDTAVLTEYDQHGRIRGGDADRIMDEARKAYLAAYLSGRDVLLMAQSHDTCRELSQRIREDLRAPRAWSATVLRRRCGTVPGPVPGTSSSPGRMTTAWASPTATRGGSRWSTVTGSPCGQMVDADRETGERRYADHTIIYNAGRTSADLAYAVDGSTEPGRQADLAYAITGHSAQGRTVAEGIALITGTETREWAYVGDVPRPGRQLRLCHHRTGPGRRPETGCPPSTRTGAS